MTLQNITAPPVDARREIAAPGSALGPTRRLVWLGRAFTLFNSARMFAYVPTFWAIHASADSSQHSLLTWVAWLCANLTMGLWLRERDGHMHRAVVVNLCNALMCLCGVALIVWYRY